MSTTEPSQVETVPYKRLPKQQSFVASVEDNYWSLYSGGRGSGKTFALYHLMIQEAEKLTTGLLAVPNHRQMNQLASRVKYMAGDKVERIDFGTSTIHFKNGSKILCRSVHPTELHNISGLAVDWICIDNLQMLDDRALVEIMCRLRGDKQKERLRGFAACEKGTWPEEWFIKMSLLHPYQYGVTIAGGTVNPYLSNGKDQDYNV